MHEKSQAQLEHETVLADLAQIALRDRGLDLLLTALTARVAKALDVDFCTVFELLPGGEAFLLRGAFGLPAPMIGSAKLEAGASSQAGYTAQIGEPIVVDDLLTEQRFRAPLMEEQVRSGVSVMIPGRDQPFGVLAAHTKTQRNFTPDEVGFLKAVAGLLGAAVENDRLHATQRSIQEELANLTDYLQRAIEDERTRISREIHDDLGQVLTALKMDLAWLSRRTEDSEIQRKLASMTALVDRGMEQVRHLSSELRPGLLDDLGLVAALEWQADEFTARTGIPCQLDAPDDTLGIDDLLATALYRIVQEALTNVARHAQASQVWIELTPESDQITLVIRDNGRGITPEEASSSCSLGLIGMRERVRARSGSIDIVGVPDQGTTVTVRAPR